MLEECSACFGTQRRAWKALSRDETLAVAPPAPEAAFSPEGTAGAAPWRLGEGRVCLRSGLRAALGGRSGGEGEAVEVTVVARRGGGGELGRWGGWRAGGEGESGGGMLEGGGGGAADGGGADGCEGGVEGAGW